MIIRRSVFFSFIETFLNTEINFLSYDTTKTFIFENFPGVRVLTQDQVDDLTKKLAAKKAAEEQQSHEQQQPPYGMPGGPGGPGGPPGGPGYGMPPPGYQGGPPPGFIPPHGMPPPWAMPGGPGGPPQGFPPYGMPGGPGGPPIEVCEWTEHTAPDGEISKIAFYYLL